MILRTPGTIFKKKKTFVFPQTFCHKYYFILHTGVIQDHKYAYILETLYLRHKVTIDDLYELSFDLA